MTEYEISDLLATTTGNATPVLALFITTISAYLITAWLVGSKLSRPQIVLVNSIFITFSLLGVWGWLARYRMAIYYQEQLINLNPERFAPIPLSAIVFVTVVYLVIIASSVKFMWDVRHPKDD